MSRGITARIGAFLAPAVGRLSMEWLTLDVTDVPEALCQRGTWVHLLDARTTIDDLADATGLAAQELLLRLGTGCRREHTGFEEGAAACEPLAPKAAAIAASPRAAQRVPGP